MCCNIDDDVKNNNSVSGWRKIFFYQCTEEQNRTEPFLPRSTIRATQEHRYKLNFTMFLFQDDFSNFEANDPWVQNFIVALDTLLGNFKVSYMAHKFDNSI